MAEQNYQRAVQILRERIGNRWEGAQREGREELARTLRAHGYSEAEDVVEAMIREGHLRYRQASQIGTADDERPANPDPVAGPVLTAPNASSGPAGMPTMPVPTGDMPGVGFWEIGREDERILGVRAGQVSPS